MASRADEPEYRQREYSRSYDPRTWRISVAPHDRVDRISVVAPVQSWTAGPDGTPFSGSKPPVQHSIARERDAIRRRRPIEAIEADEITNEPLGDASLLVYWSRGARKMLAEVERFAPKIEKARAGITAQAVLG
jgi:hypothetical protein